jgi:hypothetical protein
LFSTPHIGQIIGGPAASAAGGGAGAAPSSSSEGITGNLNPDDPDEVAATAGAGFNDGAGASAPVLGTAGIALPLVISTGFQGSTCFPCQFDIPEMIRFAILNIFSTTDFGDAFILARASRQSFSSFFTEISTLLPLSFGTTLIFLLDLIIPLWYSSFTQLFSSSSTSTSSLTFPHFPPPSAMTFPSFDSMLSSKLVSTGGLK